MKLLFCKACGDIQSLLVNVWRSCHCGKSMGRYLADGDNAELKGTYVKVIGIYNQDIRAALGHEMHGLNEFKAWFFNKDYHKLKFDE